jgi:hypothetical protein
MMGPTQLYYKPWRLVYNILASSTGLTSQSGTTIFNVIPSDLGLTSFTTGTYNFEIRFIGHRAVYPVCQSVVLTVTPPPTPTPTPTPTLPPPTVTPTPTPTLPPPEYTTGATLNVTDTGWIKYTMSSGDTYQYIGSTGTVVLTNCLVCDTIMVGIPFADLAAFTVTNCGSTCSPPPTPTPTPTATQYNIELRMNGMVERNGRFTLYQSPDNNVYTEAVVLNTIGSETAVQAFNGTPGYYYYYTVENISGPFCVANAYNTVLATDFNPNPIVNAWCDSSHVTTDWFQLPDPLQVRSYISFNGTLDSGCL